MRINAPTVARNALRQNKDAAQDALAEFISQFESLYIGFLSVKGAEATIGAFRAINTLPLEHQEPVEALLRHYSNVERCAARLALAVKTMNEAAQ